MAWAGQARDPGRGDQRRRRRQQVQGRRHGGRGLLRRVVPLLRVLRQRLRELLLRHGAHLQRHRPRARRRGHPGGLLRRHARERGLRGPRPGRAAAGQGRAAALRGRHGVQPDDALRPERAGEAPGRRRPRGPRPRRRQVRQGVRHAGHRHQHIAREARGGAGAAGRGRVPGEPGPRADAGGRGHHGRHPRHGVGVAPHLAAVRADEADGADGVRGRADQAAGAAGVRHRAGREGHRRELRRRHQGLPGHAGVRGEARHHRRGGGDQDGLRQHGARAARQERRPLPLRHRRRGQ
uniref:Uncharacterized protein n=1 Tax=Triticum urartu TaxID=4572 RepID=A0A8R7UHQ6_TRIUA